MTSPTSVLPGEAGCPVQLRDTGQGGTDLEGRRHLPRSTSPGAAGTSPDQEVPAAGIRPCGCPTGAGRVVVDEPAHGDWHALVVEQGGPVGAVNATTLRAARGFKTETLQAETLLDVRARASGKRASGKLRRAARGET